MNCIRFVWLGWAFALVQFISPDLLATCYTPAIIDMGDGTANVSLISDRSRVGNLPLNPAILAGQGPISIGFSYGSYLVSSRTAMVSFAANLGNWGLGIYTSHFTGGVINRTTGDDPAGEASGSFSYGQTAIGIGGGRELFDWLGAGVGLRVTRVDADEYSNTHTFFDGGIIVRMDQIFRDRSGDWRLNLGFVARGIRAFWSSRCEQESISEEVAFNVTSPGKTTTFAVGLLCNPAGKREIRGGLIVRPSDEFEIIIGTRRRVGDFGDLAQGFPWHRGLIGGFGSRFGGYWLNYTYEDSSPLEGIHRFMVRACLCD